MINIRKPKTALKFKKPASWWGATWREALPCGNGRVGASVFGGAGTDSILINHNDLWWQGHVGVLPDVSDKIRDVRNKIDNNSPKEAEGILSNALISKGYRPSLSVPLPLCALKVNQPLEKGVREYMRLLNLENGEATVSFKDGSTRYDRSLFVSRANDLICYEITRTGNKNIDIEFSLELPEKLNARTPHSISKLPESVATKYESFFMYFAARSDNGTDYGAVARINHFGGTMEVRQNSIFIKDAEKVLVLVKPFIESTKDKEWKALKTSLTGVKLTYDKLLKEHTALHSKLFSAVEFDLEADGRDSFIEDLIDEAQTKGEPSFALLEKLWAFGRYLFISGANPDGDRPLAPYGLWCGDYKAENSAVNAFGSVQMLYSQALSGGLGEYLLTLFSSYENMLDDLKKNATRLFLCRGIFVPALIAPGTGVFGSTDPQVLHWSGAAGWISGLMYDYAMYTDDKKFLKERALPFMKEAMQFYEDFFKVRGDGLYESNPSYSPCNTPSNYIKDKNERLDIARNSTMDFMIAKELLTNLINGSIIANVNKNDIDKWKDMLTRIPNYHIMDGIIKEYMDHKYIDNFDCKEASHLYAAYPGTEALLNTDSELFKSSVNTAKKRIVAASRRHTSLSLATYANLFARLGEGALCLDTISSMVKSFFMNNLISVSGDWRGMGLGENSLWASYTLEGNMGITSAVQEMLVGSTEGVIKILPALPESWDKGSISSLLTRTGAVVGVEWDIRKGVVTANIRSRKACVVDVQLPRGVKRYKGLGVYNSEKCLVRELSLAAGKTVSIECRF